MSNTQKKQPPRPAKRDDEEDESKRNAPAREGHGPREARDEGDVDDEAPPPESQERTPSRELAP
jgi:hypothetical protein